MMLLPEKLIACALCLACYSAAAMLPKNLNNPTAVFGDSNGNIFVTDTANARVLKYSVDLIVLTVAGGHGKFGFEGDFGLATYAALKYPYGLWVNTDGAIFIADSGNNRIRGVSVAGIISTVAGGGKSSDGNSRAATSAHLNIPIGVWGDSLGNLFVADTFNNRIVRVNSAGLLTAVAGVSNAHQSGGYTADNAVATSSQLNAPSGVWGNSLGYLYIADTGNNLVRAVSPLTRNMTSVVGCGMMHRAGNSTRASQTFVNAPLGIFGDTAGNLFVAENSKVVHVSVGVALDSAENRTVTLVAGQREGSGHGGDDGPATAAGLSQPYSVWVSADGTELLVADSGNSAVRRVVGGVISSVMTVDVNVANDPSLTPAQPSSESNDSSELSTVVYTLRLSLLGLAATLIAVLLIVAARHLLSRRLSLSLPGEPRPYSAFEMAQFEAVSTTERE